MSPILTDFSFAADQICFEKQTFDCTPFFNLLYVTNTTTCTTRYYSTTNPLCEISLWWA